MFINEQGSFASAHPETTTLVIPANAGEVVHGCTVYEPKDGIQ
jgi:hypothetical protein